MISLIIPYYNQPRQLRKCLASIFGQTYDNYEVIIVNDRSTGKFRSIMRQYREKFGYKLTVSENKANHGAPYSRNKGFKLSKGEYVIFCDADCCLKPVMLERLRRALRENPQAGYAYSSFRFGWKRFRSYPFDPELLKLTPYIHTTALIRRGAFSDFDETLKRFQDWDLWLTLLKNKQTGVFVDETLFSVASGGTMSKWLPSFAYRLLPFLKSVKNYEAAREIIRKKHGLL